MSETASISTSIAQRYAAALFELSKDDKALPVLESDTNALSDALTAGPELGAMISSPVYTRFQQGAAITALAKNMQLSPLFTNTLGLMADKRRLFALPQLIVALKARIADEKGEVTADVTSAQPLTATQQKALAKTLKEQVGKDVILNTTVDESLIGGLVVKVGSKMIDSSIRSKLANLQNVMKEVG